MFGLVVHFRLRPGREKAFDELASDVLAGVRSSEPRTLVYASHDVEGDPLSRVFYEVYADRGAFEEHEAQEHTRWFLAEREACVDGPPEVTFLTVQEAKGIPKAAGEG